MTDNLIKTIHPFIRVGDFIKATSPDTFEGYLVRFGAPTDRDLHREWFSAETYFMQKSGYPIKGRPINYQHGMDTQWGNLPIGMFDFADENEIGLFVRGQLHAQEQYMDMLRELGRAKGITLGDDQLRRKSETAMKAVRALISGVKLQQSMGADVAAYKVNDDTGHIDQCGIVHGALTPTPADDKNPVVQFKSAWQYVTSLDNDRTTFVFHDTTTTGSQSQTVNPTLVNPIGVQASGSQDHLKTETTKQETMAMKPIKEFTPEDEEILRALVKEVVLELSEESGMEADEDEVLAMTDEMVDNLDKAETEDDELKAETEDDETQKAEDEPVTEDELQKRLKRHINTILPNRIKKHMQKQGKVKAGRRAIAQQAISSYQKSAPAISRKSQVGGYQSDSNGETINKNWGITGRAEKPSISSVVKSIYNRTYKAQNPYIGNLGGYLTGEEIATEILEPLRAKVVMFDMGVRQRSVSGVGIYTVPKMTTAPTAYRPGINQTITPSEAHYDTITAYLRPIAAQVIIPRQMLLTSQPGFDQQIKDEMIRSLRLAIDSEILFGTGTVVNGTGAQIKGILSVLEENSTLATTNISTLATDGRKPAYTDLIAAETQIATGNVMLDDTTSGWVMHPRTRGTFRSLTTTTGEPLLFDNYGQKPYQDLIGYKVGLSTQVPINITAGANTDTSYIFAGNYYYSEYVMANDIELIVDEVTLAGELQVRIIAYTYSDFIVHYPEAFYVMKGVRA